MLACLGLAHGLAVERQHQYDAVPQGVIDPSDDVINEAAKKLPGKLWPLPAWMENGDKTAPVSPGANFFSLSGSTKSSFLTAAFERYQGYAFPHTANDGSKPSGSQVTGLELTVEDLDDSHPQLETDESYTLKVPATGGKAKATSKTVYGALRALETFSQLVRFDFDANGYTVPGAPWDIKDAPRFQHRGLMIDTARHYQPLASIRAIIDSLQYAKLNVLHWHMVDTQSFPFEVKSHPKLWDAAHLPSQRYTQADVAGIVEYARMRGVRVMVEFDVPGHAESWCEGEPGMCLEGGCATEGAATQPLNVASETTWTVITDLLKEVTGDKKSTRGKPSGLFPDNMVHLGGDEVATNCWESDSKMGDFKSKNSLSDGEDLYSYFVSKAGKIAQAKGRRPVQWAEAWGAAHTRVKLHKDSIVHVWQSTTNVAEVVADGYDVIINVGYFEQSWYLDNLEVNWKDIYSNEPCSDVDDAGCKKILGGHGEMWGETVDASNVMHTVWPRLGAIAEKLWSARDATAVEAGAVADGTRARFRDFRCLLLERGVGAAPGEQPFARSAPEGPGSCAQ
eukprot:Transcript_29514.p2 GENE.Transcript_29514~~Transcript_29514.p2  ORF type:complete len:586 (-),score=168.89 Transcript_29514:155-1849(-)